MSISTSAGLRAADEQLVRGDRVKRVERAAWFYDRRADRQASSR